MSEGRQVFLTGASGCIGHYVVERLLADPRNRLHVLLRDPTRLRSDLRERVTVHLGRLEDFEQFEPLLAQMDDAVFIAAAWGGVEARRVNVDAPVAMADALFKGGRVLRVIYFSTASVLSNDGRILEAARDHGTGYIRQKLAALSALANHPLGERLITVFPTIVLGGDDRHPYSHAMAGLPRLIPFLPFLRRITLDGSLHVIHAYDAARVAAYLLDHDPPVRPVILGNPLLTIGEALGQLAEAFGQRRVHQLDVTALVALLPKIFPDRFTSWDRFCLEMRHFDLPVLDIPALLGPSGFETLAGILAADPRLGTRLARSSFRPIGASGL